MEKIRTTLRIITRTFIEQASKLTLQSVFSNMESKENLNEFKDRVVELELLELESDDNINAAIKTLSLVGKIVSDRCIKFTTLCAILNRAWLLRIE
ncbi:hypothetical protein V6N13_079588 [Hibiscus sabdariffa]